VPICTSCGNESEQGFAFCPYCAAPFASAADRVQRKIVTVLFCDVVGSTALGESVDAEATRSLLALFFVRMKAIVEAHGGVVDKFIGDAVMAIFGVPLVHEDDALRSLRAAQEMRRAVPELGLEVRIGVNSGEVVTGTAERLATGDAVNVAARLQQAAEPGQVLLGVATLQLVRDAIDAAPVGPLALKGKSEPVSAWRLLSLRGWVERPSSARMVGRERELARLHAALGRAVEERSCQLFTILGSAGVGKSRLAAEFLASLGAHVVRGRCLSYGEGITYWPVVEVVKLLDAIPADETAASAIRSLLRKGESETNAETIAWAFRKLLEQEAQKQPVVCVLDDLHWGEETFLDLVEEVGDLAREAPILLLCMSRPELLHRRPGWGSGKWNTTTALLQPLDDAESDRLLDELGGIQASGEQGNGVAGKLRERIRFAAEGNPLFLEEMLALVRGSGGSDVAVPPTIQALLAARLDQLEPAERIVLERAAVAGRVFHQSAVDALCDGEQHMTARLVALVRQELIEPHRAQIPGEDAYRFRHQLIRDAAYDAAPKAVRIELHERFADWLETHARPHMIELDELLAYHLEQASRYQAQLGQPDPLLAERAGARLATAGRRALWRGDWRAAISLLERALTLTRPTQTEIALELDLANAYLLQAPQKAAAIAEAAAERARAAGDVAGEAAAGVVAADCYLEFAADPDVNKVEALSRAALPLVETSGDHALLVHVWRALGTVADWRGRYEEWAYAAQQELHHARLAGQPLTHLFALEAALASGPRPADEALRTLDGFKPDVPTPGLQLSRALLLAMLGRFGEALPIVSDASERWPETIGDDSGYGVLAELATLNGDHETAVRHLRSQCAVLEEAGKRAILSAYAPQLGRSLCALGRYDEAEPLAQLGRELGDEQDLIAQMLWRQVQALVDAHRGEYAEGERLAREAVAIAERTDGLNLQGDTLSDLARVLQAAGRDEDAADTYAHAVERFESKKNFAMAAQVREHLATLRTASASSPDG
jgi:class 3 adenylate cyclase/tetratricopeptide (TPR) repeat protein